MIRKNKNYFRYYVFFNTIKNGSNKTVAYINGRTITCHDPYFMDFVRSGVSAGNSLVSFGKHSYNVVNASNGEMIGAVDDHFNVFNGERLYSGSMHNITRVFNYVTISILATIIIFLILILSFFKTTVDNIHPNDIYITEGNGSTVNDTWNIFGQTEQEKIIMPGRKGVYYFSIHNTNYFDIEISLDFKDDNEHDIAMVYRLREGAYKYLKGSSKEYLDPSELATDSIVIPARSYVTLALDWYWDETVSDEKDTTAGLDKDAIYIIYVSIVAEQVTE